MDAASLDDNRQLTFSIRRLAEEFGMAKETVSRKLREANVQAAGTRSGHPVYRLRDACPVILSNVTYDEEGVQDPKTLPPEKRNAWYQSEQRRIDFEMETRQLIPRAEHEADLAVMTKDLILFVDALPDQLELEVGLTPEQVDRFHAHIDRKRQELYDRIVAEAASGEAAD